MREIFTFALIWFLVGFVRNTHVFITSQHFQHLFYTISYNIHNIIIEDYTNNQSL